MKLMLKNVISGERKNKINVFQQPTSLKTHINKCFNFFNKLNQDQNNRFHCSYFF